jgi:exodeoxyribonuclease-5
MSKGRSPFKSGSRDYDKRFHDIDDLFSVKRNKPAVHDDQLLLTDGKIITFNAEQYDGIKKIRVWLKTDKNFFALIGSAGTGKSCIIKKVLDEYNRSIIVSAPTHKAVGVIENFTGCEAKTLHSLLGLRADVELSDFNPNQPQFNPIVPPKINEYNWVVVDEASMINQDLYNLIKDTVKNHNTKILFIGDDAQIPPIGEKISAIFIQNEIEKHILTKVERQANDNPLLLLYDDLRNNLNKIDGGFLRKSKINNVNEGVIFTINKQEFRKAMLEKYNLPEFQKNSDFVKTIAWRNITVMQSNNIIRNNLIGKNKDIIEKGDLISGYRTITDDKQNYIIIQNSADYHVINKSNLEENQYDIKGYQVELREDLRKGKYKHETVFIVDINNHDNLHQYAEMHDFFKDMARSNIKLWKKYYEFRRNNLIMTNIDKFRNGMFRNTNEVISKDLDYGYCITGHRSQGSTYSHVFVLENDIKENWLIRERNQIFYVAVSRPSKTAMILCNRIDL